MSRDLREMKEQSLGISGGKEVQLLPCKDLEVGAYLVDKRNFKEACMSGTEHPEKGRSQNETEGGRTGADPGALQAMARLWLSL